MQRQLALLRGVNVGGQKVSMGTLREVMTAQGYPRVRTYLQSGNVVFDGGQDEEQTASSLQTLIAEHFGLRIQVVVRGRADLSLVLERDPLRWIAEDPSRHLVAFLSVFPDPVLVRSLDPDDFLPDRFAVDGRAVHLWHPDGVHMGRLSHAVLERRLQVTATARNWNTIKKLLAMLDDTSA